MTSRRWLVSCLAILLLAGVVVAQYCPGDKTLEGNLGQAMSACATLIPVADADGGGTILFCTTNGYLAYSPTGGGCTSITINNLVQTHAPSSSQPYFQFNYGARQFYSATVNVKLVGGQWQITSGVARNVTCPFGQTSCY